jgi:Domain of unknown function (DUF6916)
MPDLGELTLDAFAPLVGDTFTISGPDDTVIDSALDAATALGDRHGPDGRVPFSLIFTGADTPMLPQGVYAVHHAALGALELFLVPLAPRNGAALYQAIFS